MDLYEHFDRITKALIRNDVDFRVVGGIALSFYTAPRATVDVDLLVQDKEVDHVVHVLAKLGYVRMAPSMALAKGRIHITRLVYLKKTEHFVVDLLWSDRAPVTSIWKQARMFTYEGRRIRVMDPAGLIVLKKMRGSPQDRVDIEELKKVVRHGKKKRSQG